MNIDEFYNIRVGDRVLSDRPFPTRYRPVAYGVYNLASDGQDNPYLRTPSGNHIYTWEPQEILPHTEVDTSTFDQLPYSRRPIAVGEPAFAMIPGIAPPAYLQVFHNPTNQTLTARTTALAIWFEQRDDLPYWWRALRIMYEMHRGEQHTVTWNRYAFHCTCGLWCGCRPGDKVAEVGAHQAPAWIAYHLSL